MKRKLLMLTLAVILMSAVKMKAQNGSTTVLSATAGTQGVGLDLKYSKNPKYVFKAGSSVVPIKANVVTKISNEPTEVDVDGDFANAHVMFDWHPFGNSTSFSRKILFSAGGAYWWKRGGKATITYQGTFKYGDILIPSEDLGELIGDVKWNKVTPYLGTGIESVVSKNRFSLGFNLGVYYMGKPEASLTGTKLLAANNASSAQFQKNMDDYRFLPVLQLNLNFRL